MLEIHITCNTADKDLIDDIARERAWKTSSITGDPVLGPETRYYLTTHAKNFPKAYTEMAEMSSVLEANGIAITRQKIELIVFDTKLVDYVLPLYGHKPGSAKQIASTWTEP